MKLRAFIDALFILPYGFWGLRLYEVGFDWISAVIGVVLFFILLPVLIVFWSGP
ncbi:hypothetical protein HY489_05455 [Candidatus Woesearchaeota archaeon]|nr:hypothetical protein [Candidatus Woesearchaeota archaeon]